MSITTKDRAKLGQTTYCVSIGAWVDEYPVTVKSSELPSLVKAKQWAKRHQSEGEHANIEKGTYQADNFDDEKYGRILDASWERDEDFFCYGDWAEDGGTIRWEVS